MSPIEQPPILYIRKHWVTGYWHTITKVSLGWGRLLSGGNGRSKRCSRVTGFLKWFYMAPCLTEKQKVLHRTFRRKKLSITGTQDECVGL